MSLNNITISFEQYFSGHFTNFPSLCEALTLCSLRFAYTNMFIIDYHVNKDTPLLLFRTIIIEYCS